MRKVLCTVMGAAVLAVVSMAAPVSASAATTYNLLKQSNLSGSPAEGYSTCQHKDVTLPTLSSSNRYEWDEDFPTGNISNFSQTFHGKFYWSSCLVSMKGRSTYWTYAEYSMLTGETSACEDQGHCTTYHLQTHYVQWTGGNAEWGSQISVKPSDWCSFESCEAPASVTVTKT